MSSVAHFSLAQYETMVEVFRTPQASGYQSHEIRRADEEVRPLAFPDVLLKPSVLFQR